VYRDELAHPLCLKVAHQNIEISNELEDEGVLLHKPYKYYQKDALLYKNTLGLFHVDK
jgi:hypothetical protein